MKMRMAPWQDRDATKGYSDCRRICPTSEITQIRYGAAFPRSCTHHGGSFRYGLSRACWGIDTADNYEQASDKALQWLLPKMDV
jgi:hypothetical protein